MHDTKHNTHPRSNDSLGILALYVVGCPTWDLLDVFVRINVSGPFGQEQGTMGEARRALL